MNTEQSMDQLFIKKVTELIEVNLRNEQFGVKELTSEMGMSRSNLHLKLQSIYHKSTSQFIREYRLEKAMAMLQNNLATASEISYLVGFGSPTYFNTCFHDYYGYPPGEVKFREASASKAIEEIQISKQNKASKKQGKTTKSKKTPSIRRIISASVLGIVLILAISYLVYSYSLRNEINETTEDLIKDKSIAILPCKNLSDEENNQFFADGQMEAILNHLTSISELRVISKTTMLGYQETTKSIPEIAKELNVKYVLELSMQKMEKKIRIYARLIDADSDQQIWSNNYDRDLIDIFSIQTDIAKQVVGALEKKLSPMELEKIEKIPTKNLEAYNLYLRGRFFWDRRTEKDMKNSIDDFEQAIELDSTYAMAYAGLADSYAIMAFWGWYPENEGYIEGKKLARKAISIENSISEAHATLGMISMYHEWNWEKAEMEFKRAISLNPSYATGHHYYAVLLRLLQRNIEAREQSDLAIKLNPIAPIMYGNSARTYYSNNEFKKAIEEEQKFNKFFNVKSDMLIFKSYVHLGMDKKAIKNLKIIIPNSPNNIHRNIEKIYQESGINGVIYWRIEQIKLSYKLDAFRLYGLVGDRQKTIAYLRKNPTKLLEFQYSPDFKLLRSDSVFIAQLQSLELIDNNLKVKNAAFQKIKKNLLIMD